MKFVKFYTLGVGDPIYINPELVSCVCPSDNYSYTYIIVPGALEPFEVRGEIDYVIAKLRSASEE